MSSCRLTAVRSDPVTPQSPTLQGPLCAWQNCKLLPVALEALLNQPCRPWPHLSALTSPSPVGLGLTCQPWPHLSALTSPSPVGLGLTCCLLYQLTVHPLASRQPLAPCGRRLDALHPLPLPAPQASHRGLGTSFSSSHSGGEQPFPARHPEKTE